jgi:CDP-diacylglycerol--glycerol-3-phosphate 3-phosphatidyltransferase
VSPPRPHVSSWNLANYLTVLRLAMVPVFAVLLLARDGEDDGFRLAAAVVYLLAALTDYVDGEVARNRGLITSFGKIVDPIADKALTGAAFVGLSVLGELPWWVTAVVLVREAGITLLRFWVIRHGVMPAGRGGKLKTVLQNVALVLLVLPLPDALAPVEVAAMAAAVLVTVATGVDYVVKALRLRRTSARADMKRARRAAADREAA